MQTPKQIRWGSSGAAYERYLERQQSEYSIQSLLVSQTRPSYCNAAFIKLLILFLSVYVSILVMAWLVWLFYPTTGTFLLVILPGLWFVAFSSVYYRKIIIVIQIFRAIGCVALSIFPIFLIRLAFEKVFHLPEHGFCGLCMLNKVVVAFIVNAFIETLLKYTILIILNDELIVDPRSFFVLSIVIGAGFSVLRVVYLLCTNRDTSLSMALYYCFDAPVQCLTTIYMGICFADELFFEYPKKGFGCILPPLLIHGLYLLIVESTILESKTLANQLLMLLSMFSFFSIILPYVRWKFTKYGEIVPADLREQIALGLIQHPCPSLCGPHTHFIHQMSLTSSPPENFFTPSRNNHIPVIYGRRHISPTFESTTDVQFSFETGGGAFLPPQAVVSSVGSSRGGAKAIRQLGRSNMNPPLNSHARSVSTGMPHLSVFGD